MQVTFDQSQLPQAVFDLATTIRNEYVLAVKGVLAERDEKMVNKNMATGRYEVRAKELKILSVSETPPSISRTTLDASEQIRLKYRYLDLRRPVCRKTSCCATRWPR